MEIKHAQGKDDYQNNAKKYVINMMKGSQKTLHIKNGCYYAESLEYYVDFDTFEEVKKSGVKHIECDNCFGKD